MADDPTHAPPGLAVGERLVQLRERLRQILPEPPPVLADICAELAGLLDELAAATAGEARFRGLLEAAPDALVIVGADGRIRLVNRQTEALFGYDRAELIGQPVELLVPARLRSVHLQHRTAYAAAPRSRPMGSGLPLYGQRRDGTEFPVEVSLSPLMLDGDLLVMSAIRDISDRKATEDAIRQAMREAEQAREEAERANAAKSEFLSRMSHELRTPLNAVLGFAQLLAMDPLPPAQERSVARILRAGRHLLDLVNEVLDIARIESGRLPLSPEPVRVAEAVREAVDLVRPLATEHQVVLLPGTAETCNRYVLADRQRLKQVLLNLLTNAIKYNRPGGTVTVRWEAGPAPTATGGGEPAQRPEELGRLRLAVEDTGPGITPDKLSRLFTPFDRLGAEATGVEGTGLGLALTQRLVEAMGGRIVVASTVGKGSTFTVELQETEHPLVSHGRAGAVEIEGAATPAVSTARTHTVLYIEDNLPNFELIEELLTRWPHVALLPAMQGRLGVELARQHQPDLILLDVHLPDISGEEVLRQLRADPRTCALPVVVLSADATPGRIERLLAAGARAYLTKPLDVAKFLALIGDLLEQRTPDEAP